MASAGAAPALDSADRRSLAPAAHTLPSPTHEDWDNDGDFDFDNEVEEVTKFGHGTSSIFAGNVGAQPRTLPVASKGVKEGEAEVDWDADEDVDEDQVETIKLSSVAGSALAHLAQLSAAAKQPLSSADGTSAVTGTVTHLGKSSLFTGSTLASRVDMEGGGDWDEDLEIPDVFPTRSLRRPASFASDLETGTPSLGSTSGSTSRGARSDSQGLTDVEGDVNIRAGPSTPSKGGLSSSSISSDATSLISPPRPADFPVAINSKSSVHTGWDGDDDSDFDLEPGLQRLSLSPGILVKPSSGALEQQGQSQRTMWDSGDEAKTHAKQQRQGGSSPPPSGEGTDAEEGATEDDDFLDGLEFPDLLFGSERNASSAKATETASAVTLRLEALLNARRGSGFLQSQRQQLSSEMSDHDISDGLIITDDIDLSPSRLRAKNLRYKLRQQSRLNSASPPASSPSIPTAPRAMLRSANRPAPPRAPSAYSHGQSQASSTLGRASKGQASDARSSHTLGRSSSPVVDRRSHSSMMESGNSSGVVQGRGSSSMRGARPSTPSTRSSVPWRAPSRADSIDSLHMPPARPSTPSSFQQEAGGSKRRVSTIHPSAKRYTMPTNASRARQSQTSCPSTESGLDSPVQPTATAQFMRFPRSLRTYGDGRELDAFDDLPTSSFDRSSTSSLSRPVKTTRSATTADRSGSKSSYSHATDSHPHAESSHKPQGKTRIDDDASTTTSARSRSSRKRRGTRKKQKTPYLIRNLASATMGPRIVGDMRWNPGRQRWEGNEREMKDFDNALHSSARPALITQLSPLSASSLMQGSRTQSVWSGRPDPLIPLQPIMPEPRTQSKGNSQGQNDGQSPGGVRIVGDMIFDPIELRWTHKSGVEEPDPFEEGENEEDDLDEGEGNQRTARYTSLTSLKDDDMEDDPEEKKDEPVLSSGSYPEESASSWARRSRSSEHLDRPHPRARPSDAPASSQFGKGSSSTIRPGASSSALPPRRSKKWQGLTDQTYRHVEKALSSVNRENIGKKREALAVPDDLKVQGISERLWQETIQADVRHRTEMSGFLPSTYSSATAVSGAGRNTRDRKGSGRQTDQRNTSSAAKPRSNNDALYLLQRMARQAGR